MHAAHSSRTSVTRLHRSDSEMPEHVHRVLSVVCVAALVACGGDGALAPAGGTFTVGQSLAVESGRDARVIGGATGGRYIAVVTNLSLDSIGSAAYSLRASGISSAPSQALFARSPIAELSAAIAASPPRDEAFEDGLRTRERRELTPRFAMARHWNAARVPALPSTPVVGGLVTINVNAKDACANPIYHVARVVAIGTKALVLADTLNPKNGFTTADYQRYAARFDTLVYPLDVTAFGTPTDIDNNGRIAIVFTRAVNELTERNSLSFVGGLTFSRDLFPQAGTARTQPCPTSNEGEYFYLLAPDPTGSINGNRRTTGFVDSNTTAVIAHEFVHLINASRKLYVNTGAPQFERKWLDEGLAHMAEELLFYRESGLSPRSNLDYTALALTARTRAAYAADMAANASRYHEYLTDAPKSSPYQSGDSLSTRGGAWSLLRYLADRTSSSDGTVWSRLVDNTNVGTANLESVFGRDFGNMLRDWTVSHAVDGTPGVPVELQQPSWNWHSVFAGAGSFPLLYPLPVTAMDGAQSYTGTAIAGGSAYYQFEVPANGTATLTLGGQSGAAGSNLQLVIVRTQ